MSVLTVIKKIGEKVISIVEYPIKHAIQIAELLGTAEKDAPEVKTAIVGLVEQFDAIGPDAIAIYASKGVNVAADLDALAKLQALFQYFSGTFVPAIEAAYTDLKSDIPSPATPTPNPAPASPTPTETPAPSAEVAGDVAQSGPGLHAVTAA